MEEVKEFPDLGDRPITTTECKCKSGEVWLRRPAETERAQRTLLLLEGDVVSNRVE